jgi:hypothetical protein
MSDGKYQPLTDMEDLPRTLRREHESRERAAREQATREQLGRDASDRATWNRSGPAPGQMPIAAPSAYGTPEQTFPYEAPAIYRQRDDEPVNAIVRRIKVPFFSLMGFGIKAVFAFVPALLILMAMLYGVGLALQAYIPQLIKMKIVITFPG